MKKFAYTTKRIRTTGREVSVCMLTMKINLLKFSSCNGLEFVHITLRIDIEYGGDGVEHTLLVKSEISPVGLIRWPS